MRGTKFLQQSAAWEAKFYSETTFLSTEYPNKIDEPPKHESINSQEYHSTLQTEEIPVIQTHVPSKHSDLQLLQIHEVEPVSIQSQNIHEAKLEASQLAFGG